MTTARRVMFNPAAPAPAGKNIASQLGAASGFRGSAYLFMINGQLWRTSGYSSSPFRALLVSYDSDLNILQQGRFDLGSSPSYGAQQLVEVSGRYYMAFSTLAGTRQHAIVEVDANLNIVGTNYQIWDDNGSNNNLTYIRATTDGTHIYTCGMDNGADKITIIKFDLDLNEVAKVGINTSELSWGICANSTHLFVTSIGANRIRIRKLDFNLNAVELYDCASAGSIQDQWHGAPIWRSGFIYQAVTGRNANNIDDLMIFKMADDGSLFDRVRGNAISGALRNWVIHQIAFRPNGNLLIAAQMDYASAKRPAFMEFDTDLDIINQFVFSNEITESGAGGCAAGSNDTAYFAYRRNDGNIFTYRFDDMSFPVDTSPPCLAGNILNLSQTFEKVTLTPNVEALNTATATPGYQALALTDGPDILSELQNCEFIPS